MELRERVGRGLRRLETRNRKVNRVPVRPSTDMVTDLFDQLGDDDDDMQGPSKQEMAHLLGEMAN